MSKAAEITLQRRSQAVAALPPNIEDITEILRKQKPVDPKLVQRQQQAAAGKPPARTSKAKLAKFYFDRGKAAGNIGKTDQEMSDLAEAARLAKTAGDSELQRSALWELANAQGAAGLRKGGLANREAALKLAKREGRILAYNAILAIAYAQAGMLDVAEQRMATVRKLLNAGMPQNVWRKLGRHFTVRIQFAQAVLYESKGEFDKAENLYRNAIRLQEAEVKAKTPEGKKWGGYVLQVARSRLSRMLEAQGRFVEAEVVIRKALLDRLGESGLNSTWTPRLLIRFAEHLAAQGRYEESRQLTNTATGVMQKIGFADDTLRMVAARLLLARLEFLAGREADALAIYDALEKALEKSGRASRRAFGSDVDRLLVYAAAGRHDEVLPLLRKSSDAANTNTVTDHKIAGAVKRGALAVALYRSGDPESAYAEFQQVVPTLIAATDLPTDEEYVLGTAREDRNAVIFEAYLDLLAEIRGTPLEAELGIDAAAEAFRIADAVRGQLVERAVSAAAARATIRDKALAELVRSEQDARKRLTAQGGVLAGILATPTDQQDPGAIGRLRAEIAELKKAIEVLNADIAHRFPEYAALLSPQAPDLTAIQAALRPEEAFVSIYLGKDRSFIWALPKSGGLVFATGEMNRAKTAEIVAALRKSLDPKGVENLGQIPEFDIALAHELYKVLLQPVEPGWREAKSLLVSANGALGQLPLTVLPIEAPAAQSVEGPLFQHYRDVKWLARSHAMTVLPSAATLVTLRKLPKAGANREPFIGFGNPFFRASQLKDAKKPPVKVADAAVRRGDGTQTRSLAVRLRAAPFTEAPEKPDMSRLIPLPDTEEEVSSIARAMGADPSNSLMIRLKANEDRVNKGDLDKYRVIAFATHGLISGDLGLRQPALALSAPGLAKVGGDGLLTMSEIMKLDLDADWVILSACNTGSGRGDGAEAVSGLGRAFFYAGSRALLVSSWPVDTIAARLLTTDVFARLAKDPSLTRATALQQTVSALIDRPGELHPETQEPLYYYAHPLFWAPFIIVGDGGGGV